MNSLLDALEYHRQLKKRIKDWNRKHYSGLRFEKRKKPWYFISTGKQYNYEERTEPYGQAVQYYRVKSEAAIATKKTTIQRMTKEKYKDLLFKAKIHDWLKRNPRPILYDPQQPDLFEAEFMLPWIIKHTQARENISNFVDKIGNKVFVYARYIGDTGYPNKIMEFRSDHKPLLIADGRFVNDRSKTIKKAQTEANRLALTDSRFVALKIIDGDKMCILIPQNRLTTAA